MNLFCSSTVNTPHIKPSLCPHRSSRLPCLSPAPVPVGFDLDLDSYSSAEKLDWGSYGDSDGFGVPDSPAAARSSPPAAPPCDLLAPVSIPPSLAVSGESSVHNSIPSPSLPPPAGLSTPLVAASAPEVNVAGQGWIEVRGRHRPQQVVPSPSAPGEGSGSRLAFLQKLRGRCFRCLAHDHFVSACRDPV